MTSSQILNGKMKGVILKNNKGTIVKTDKWFKKNFEGNLKE